MTIVQMLWLILVPVLVLVVRRRWMRLMWRSAADDVAALDMAAIAAVDADIDVAVDSAVHCRLLLSMVLLLRLFHYMEYRELEKEGNWERKESWAEIHQVRSIDPADHCRRDRKHQTDWSDDDDDDNNDLRMSGIAADSVAADSSCLSVATLLIPD